jgi:hypothetical protein
MSAARAESLVRLVAQRAEWVTGRPDGRPDRDSAESTVLVVLRSLDLADLVHGACRFAADLDPDEAGAWRRSWTRTRFLFGNPANLVARDRPRVVAPGGSAAWLGPFPDGRLPGRSRLLKPVTGSLPRLPGEVDVPGEGPARLLRVAVEGLSLVDYLVHLHHTLAEAVLLGRLSPGERVRVSHQPSIEWEPDDPAYARVLPGPGTDLRQYTSLAAA